MAMEAHPRCHELNGFYPAYLITAAAPKINSGFAAAGLRRPKIPGVKFPRD